MEAAELPSSMLVDCPIDIVLFFVKTTSATCYGEPDELLIGTSSVVIAVTPAIPASEASLVSAKV